MVGHRTDRSRPRPTASTPRRRSSLRRTSANTCALPREARVRPLSSTTPQTPNAGVEERLISRRRTTTSNDQRRRDLETRLTVVNDRAAFPISRRQEATTRSVRTVHHCRRQVAMVHRRRHHHHPPPTIHYHHRHPLRSRPTSNPPPHHHTSLTHTRPPITPPLHPTPESFFWVTSTPPTSKFSPPPWAPPLRRWRPCFARPGTLVDKAASHGGAADHFDSYLSASLWLLRRLFAVLSPKIDKNSRLRPLVQGFSYRQHRTFLSPKHNTAIGSRNLFFI